MWHKSLTRAKRASLRPFFRPLFDCSRKKNAHCFALNVPYKKIRFSSLFAETSPAAKSEEKRMFSQATVYTDRSSGYRPALSLFSPCIQMSWIVTWLLGLIKMYVWMYDTFLFTCKQFIPGSNVMKGFITSFHIWIFFIAHAWLTLLLDYSWLLYSGTQEWMMMMKPLFKCHKILVHYSTNWGH